MLTTQQPYRLHKNQRSEGAAKSDQNHESIHGTRTSHFGSSQMLPCLSSSSLTCVIVCTIVVAELISPSIRGTRTSLRLQEGKLQCASSTIRLVITCFGDFGY